VALLSIMNLGVVKLQSVGGELVGVVVPNLGVDGDRLDLDVNERERAFECLLRLLSRATDI